MKLIVGLGNPGTQYAKTRHNTGFMVVDRLHARLGAGATVKSRFKSATAEIAVGDQRCILMKPTTYMNLSGQAVAEAVGFYKLDLGADVLVIVDDLYLPTGAVRLRPGGGTGGHNGLEDLHRALATDAYPRLRIGVGLQPSGGKPPLMDQADFVLSRFMDDEEPLLGPALAKAEQGAEVWVKDGLAKAMNFVNGPEGRKRPDGDKDQDKDAK